MRAISYCITRKNDDTVYILERSHSNFAHMSISNDNWPRSFDIACELCKQDAIRSFFGGDEEPAKFWMLVTEGKAVFKSNGIQCSGNDSYTLKERFTDVKKHLLEGADRGDGDWPICKLNVGMIQLSQNEAQPRLEIETRLFCSGNKGPFMGGQFLLDLDKSELPLTLQFRQEGAPNCTLVLINEVDLSYYMTISEIEGDVMRLINVDEKPEISIVEYRR